MKNLPNRGMTVDNVILFLKLVYNILMTITDNF